MESGASIWAMKGREGQCSVLFLRIRVYSLGEVPSIGFRVGQKLSEEKVNPYLNIGLDTFGSSEPSTSLVDGNNFLTRFPTLPFPGTTWRLETGTDMTLSKVAPQDTLVLNSVFSKKQWLVSLTCFIEFYTIDQGCLGFPQPSREMRDRLPHPCEFEGSSWSAQASCWKHTSEQGFFRPWCCTWVRNETVPEVALSSLRMTWLGTGGSTGTPWERSRSANGTYMSSFVLSDRAPPFNPLPTPSWSVLTAAKFTLSFQGFSVVLPLNLLFMQNAAQPWEVSYTGLKFFLGKVSFPPAKRFQWIRK